MTDAKFEEIKHLLKTAYCNPLWRKHILALVAEIDRLKKTQHADENLRSSDVGDDHDFMNDTVFL